MRYCFWYDKMQTSFVFFENGYLKKNVNSKNIDWCTAEEYMYYDDFVKKHSQQLTVGIYIIMSYRY